MVNIFYLDRSEPDFSLLDPQRAEFEQRYKGMQRPHFRGGDVTICRPMTRLELEQYWEYRQRMSAIAVQRSDYQMPF